MKFNVPHHPAFWLSLLSLVVLTACRQESKPRAFNAPKQDTEFVVAPPRMPNASAPFASGMAPRMGASTIPANEKRILGAIFPLQGGAFFLKITDTIDRIEKIKGPFPEVVASFNAAPDTGKPEFSLPEGWVMKPGDDFAVAKVDIPVPGSDKPAVMTISKLAFPPDESQWAEYVLVQMNRWNGQVSLPDQSLEEMMASLQRIPREGSKIDAYLFDKNGSTKSVSTDSGDAKAAAPIPPNPDAKETIAPTESNAPPATELSSAGLAPPPASDADHTPTFDASKLQLDAPPEWEKQPDRAFRLATFRVPGGEQEPDGELVVSQAVDNPLENSKMWSEQILKTEDTALIDSKAKDAVDSAETIPAGKREAKLYSIRSGDSPESSTLLIAVIPMDQTPVSMFVKLRGSLKLTEQQKSNLLRFVDSMRWE